jgi:hypothetical protein
VRVRARQVRLRVVLIGWKLCRRSASTFTRFQGCVVAGVG